MEARKLEAAACERYKMIPHLEAACACCKMCNLGWSKARDEHNPHVFSSYDPKARPAQFMIVGQNPGWNEVKEGAPFVGAAGRNFEKELVMWGRTDFYITNAVKCFTDGNKQPSLEQVTRCEPFLRMEIAILKPKLVVAFGATAFAALVPNAIFSSAIGKITTSDKFDVKVFTTYHPSPLNMLDKPRKKQFAHDMKLLGQVMGKYLSPF